MPFLANQSFGVDNYKWILFGEDDTVFFVENALKLLGHLDHELPYFLTDNIQYPQKHIDGTWTMSAVCGVCVHGMQALLQIPITCACYVNQQDRFYLLPA